MDGGGRDIPGALIIVLVLSDSSCRTGAKSGITGRGRGEARGSLGAAQPSDAFAQRADTRKPAAIVTGGTWGALTFRCAIDMLGS